MVEIREHDPQWSTQFQELQTVLSAALGTSALRIEHVGSTAVVGLPAKPILDIDIVIDSPEHLPTIVAELGKLGYLHQGDKGIPGREAFGRTDSRTPCSGTPRSWPQHHLYVCAKDSDELARHWAFRDYLRAHPSTASAYATLKRSLAAQSSGDREAYTDGKAEFVREVLRLADRES